MNTAKIERKISYLQAIIKEMADIEKMIKRLQTYIDNKTPAKTHSTLSILDSSGHNSVSINAHHLARYPAEIQSLLQLRLAELEAERDELQEIFRITERLFSKE